MSKTTKAVIADFKSNLDTQGLTGMTGLSQGVVAGLENADESTKGNFITIENVTDTVAGLESEEFSPAQKTAASFAGAMGLDPKGSLQRSVDNVGIDASLTGATGIAAERAAGLESFDGQRGDDYAAMSFAFNLKVTRQAPWAEAIFPITIIDPSSSGIEVKLDVATITQAFLRTGVRRDGDRFNRVKMVQAMTDINGPLGEDRNRVIPVLRASSEGVVASDAVMISTASRTVTIGGESVTTAPIKTGERVALLGISQTDASLHNGVENQTSALDRAIKLENLYVEIPNSDDSKKDLFRVNVEAFAFAQFLPGREGDSKDVTLAFETDAVSFDTDVTKRIVAGGEDASAVLAEFGEGIKIRTRVIVNGAGNTQDGDIALYSGKVELISVIKDGVVLEAGDETYEKVAAGIAKSTVAGYDVIAYKTNSNLSVDLPIVNVDERTQVYNVPVRSGFRVQRPISAAYGDDNTAAKVDGAISATFARMNVSAAIAIDHYLTGLKAAKAHGVDISTLETTGIARYVVNTSFFSDVANMTTIVDSRRSGERDEDISGALIAKIKRGAAVLNEESKYTEVLSLYEKKEIKPTLMVIAASGIAAYLPTEEDLGFAKAEFYPAPKDLIGDRIIFSFGGLTEAYSGEFHPLNSGVCGYRPEIVVEAIKTTGNATDNDLIGNPSFLHFVNLPVWGEIVVTGLDSVTNKVPVITTTAE